MEKVSATERLGDDRQQRYTRAAGRFAENGDVFAVAAEERDILLHPSERLNLIEDAQIRRVGKVRAALELREIHKAHQADAIADGNENDIGILLHKIRAVIQRVGGTAPTEAAAVEKHHDRLLCSGIGTIHPNVQIQTILTLRIVGALLGLPLRLDRAFAEIIGFINAVVLRRGRGTLPSTAADRRLGVRDPPKGKDPLVLLSDERTVITLLPFTP